MDSDLWYHNYFTFASGIVVAKIMRCLLFTVVVLACVASSWQYCYMKLEPAGSTECSLRDGTIIAIGSTLDRKERCERCSCGESRRADGTLVMSCCGYGIHAGVIMPPPGCKIATGNDGCTPTIVQLADESKLC